jgi:hypothetical protein
MNQVKAQVEMSILCFSFPEVAPKFKHDSDNLTLEACFISANAVRVSKFFFVPCTTLKF